jgi:hypothetical protein
MMSLGFSSWSYMGETKNARKNLIKKNLKEKSTWENYE